MLINEIRILKCAGANQKKSDGEAHKIKLHTRLPRHKKHRGEEREIIITNFKDN